MKSKVLILLASIGMFLGIWSCDSPPIAQVVEPTATSVLQAVEVPTPVAQTPSARTTDHSPTPTPTQTETPTETATIQASIQLITPEATAVAGADPDLKPGFPVVIGKAPNYFSLVVGNINSNPFEEIVALPAFGMEPNVTVVEPDGSTTTRWAGGSGANPPLALGDFSNASPGLEIVSYFIKKREVQRAQQEWEAGISIYSGSGDILPRWPITQPFTGPFGFRGPLHDLEPPITLDLDGDGLDEVFAYWKFLKADGTIIPGWERTLSFPAVGDLDQDGKPEIIAQFGGSVPLAAFHMDGSPAAGFVLQLPEGWTTMGKNPVIGDVDGDGVPEVLAVIYDMYEVSIGDPKEYQLAIIAADGHVKHLSSFMEDPNNFMVLALGDLDCDGAAEIVLQTATKVYVWKGDGSTFPGWPQEVGVRTSYSPLIGDVDGDGKQDIVVLSTNRGLSVYSSNGQLLPRFPKTFHDSGANIAIADLDRDGRNEIIVAGADQDINSAVWVFDLRGPGPYGDIQWGQYLGGPQHHSNWKSSSYCSR
ncbi:MAG TPA: VCBS repeat-containing protein [Chloroflexia bacterium]|nr:VCBS repeat-containing protein [Chloroflexia bacterium]